MLIHHEPRTVASNDAGWSGSFDWIGNTAHKLHGQLQQIYVKADTPLTSFKFKLTDNQSRIIFDEKDFQIGTMNRINLFVPLKGFYEMSIYSSDKQETFEILLGIREAE